MFGASESQESQGAERDFSKGGKTGLVIQEQQKLLLGLPTSYILTHQDQGATHVLGEGKEKVSK